MQWDHIDWDKRILHIPDTTNGHPRTIPLTPTAIRVLEELPRINSDVIGMSGNAIRLAWERLKKKAGVKDLRFHDLRHEAISRFFEMGLSVPEVALISGHRDPRMLFRYTHLRAEEVGKNIRILEMFGLPGIKNVNQYFIDKKVKKFENLNLIIEKNLTASEPFCPIILGVSFLDQIKTMESLKKIEFTSIAYPILFLPFLSRASEIIGKKIHIKFDQKEILLNLNVNIYSNILNQELKVIANNVEVKFLENLDNFTDSEWQNLYKLSENTFVEESESLKQGGAGAGLTDND